MQATIPVIIKIMANFIDRIEKIMQMHKVKALNILPILILLQIKDHH